MAHKKAAGSTSLGRESESKRLGLKKTDGEWAKVGAILVRQRGTKYNPGKNVKKGKDDTLFAMKPGFVKFTTKKIKKFDNSLRTCKVVSIIPLVAKSAPVKAAAKKAAPVKK